MSSVLRIVDLPVGAGRRRVTVRLEGPGVAPREAVAQFGYAPDTGDAELVRWYLEDYAEFPADPAPAIARRAEARLAAVGRDLFGRVFRSGDPASLWTLATSAAGRLSRLRVEVDADPADVPGLPWELLRESGTGGPVVLAAGQFVRTHLQSTRMARLPEPSGDHLRVLLVICRPGGREDVPFRSVASRLVRGGAQQVDGLDLDVLRPPTYARLAQVLREAADAGRPYHVVHFDGHGAFLDATALTADGEDTDQGMGAGAGAGGVGVSPWLYGVSVAGPVRSGRHGYLLFEGPTAAEKQQLVDGATLGALLSETQVPVLVLNACRSAYAEAPTSPRSSDDDTSRSGAPEPGGIGAALSGGGAVPEAGSADVDADDVHARVRAYGSLAAEVADAGVPGVVAMRYNVYVVTAAQFVADLYAHLLAGKTLGQAGTAARKALADDPTRLVGATAVALQDWTVPTVYEAAPLALLRPANSDVSRIRVDVGDATASDMAAGPEVGVPKAPDVGFFGRDETLLALDRAFDTQPVVLLHAYAGAGKSTTAAEFARWYHVTGGLDDPKFGAGAVVWTSFEQHLPLPKALNAVGDAFADSLEANGIHWQAITNHQTRRKKVLQLLAQTPVLWVWDNVEPVAGFPAGTPSAWTDTEQNELVDFLRDLATKTRCRVLLTSRRDEQPWLGDLPVRVKLPPMPMRERLQLTHALAARHRPGQPLPELDWRPLLRYTGGNPLTITVTVRQALREQLNTTADVDAYVQRLHAGETPLESQEDAALGRTRSLAASLDYGFTHAFTDAERAQLALLHLFRDTVDVDALRGMGEPTIAGDDAVPALASLTSEAGIALLGRAAEIGLLTDHGGGYYGIHPALPWYFTTLYTHHHATPGKPTADACERAYTNALAQLSNYYTAQAAGAGRASEVVPILAAEEANLLHALHLARSHNLPDAEINCMQGLRMLYAQTGRTAEWARLVELVIPDYLDPTTETPLPGREDHYTLIAEYRIRIARDARDWPTTTRLQQADTAWNRQRAAPYLDIPADQLDNTGHTRIRNLAVAAEGYGVILYLQRDAACLTHLKEALDLYQRIGLRQEEANIASTIGTAYLAVPALRDLDQAQHWHQYSLNHTPQHDRVGRAASHGQLAMVALERYYDACDADATEATLLEHLNTALAGYQQALALTPPHHAEYMATFHNQHGVIYAAVGDTTKALRHYQQSIKHEEDQDNTYGAGQARFSVALLLARDSRYDDALQYANAALTNYRAVGLGAIAEATRVETLITHLQQQKDANPQQTD
jgi:tetratricopeptide (TPR) repeat protein